MGLRSVQRPDRTLGETPSQGAGAIKHRKAALLVDQLSKWAKEKLQSNPDMIRQRALAIAHDHGTFEKSFSHPCAVENYDPANTPPPERPKVASHLPSGVNLWMRSYTLPSLSKPIPQGRLNWPAPLPNPPN
jgi:hypothetical protein